MDPHPDFAEVDWPRRFPLGAFELAPLTMDVVDEDYSAVMRSAPLLGEVFGDWPEGLTLEDNRIDLAWHDREFTARRSFAWVLRDGSGFYLGCFYIYPDIGVRGAAQAILWIADVPDRGAVAAAVRAELDTWLEANLPTGVALRWQVSPEQVA